MSEYFDFTTSNDLDRRTLARAESLNQLFQAIEDGFNLLPTSAEIKQNRSVYVVATGPANAYVAAPTTAWTAYTEGAELVLKIPTTNTGASTVNVSTLGVKSIKRYDGTDPGAGELLAGSAVPLRYVGTSFRMTGVHPGDLALANASALAAAQSAVDASGFATAAGSSATTAAASAAAAALSYDSFDDRYLGAKASDPTLDNDGNALLTGALYWNTTSSNLRIYNGAAWVVIDLPIAASTTASGIAELATQAEVDARTDAVRIVTPNTLAEGLGAKGTDIASASSLTLPTVGDYFNVTGTVSVTAISTRAAGREITLTFSAALTFTHNATSLILPGSASITTAAGDVATMRSLGSGNWKCVGYAKASGAAVVVASTTPTITRSTRTSNTILAAGDQGSLIDVTSGTFTQTLTAAATLGSGWFCHYRNSGTGIVTIDPNSAETIDSRTTVAVYPGESFTIECDGSNFNTVGRRRKGSLILIQEQVLGSSVANVDFTLGFTDTELDSMEFEFFNLTGASSQIGFRISQSGTFQTTGYNDKFTKWTGSAVTSASQSGSIDLTDSTISSGAYQATGRVWLPNHRSSTLNKNIIADSAHFTGVTYVGMYHACVFDGSTAAFDGARFLFQSANLSTGTIRQYGRRT